MHTAHTEDSPGAPVSVGQEGPHYWAPQNTFYTKALFKDQEKIGDLPNTQKQKISLYEETNMFQTKEQDKTSEKELNEMELS